MQEGAVVRIFAVRLISYVRTQIKEGLEVIRVSQAVEIRGPVAVAEDRACLSRTTNIKRVLVALGL